MFVPLPWGSGGMNLLLLLRTENHYVMKCTFYIVCVGLSLLISQ
jgi:hypothetical protein